MCCVFLIKLFFIQIASFVLPDSLNWVNGGICYFLFTFRNYFNRFNRRVARTKVKKIFLYNTAFSTFLLTLLVTRVGLRLEFAPLRPLTHKIQILSWSKGITKDKLSTRKQNFKKGIQSIIINPSIFNNRHAMQSIQLIFHYKYEQRIFKKQWPPYWKSTDKKTMAATMKRKTCISITQST